MVRRAIAMLALGVATSSSDRVPADGSAFVQRHFALSSDEAQAERGGGNPEEAKGKSKKSGKKPARKEKVEQEILDPEIGKAKPKGKAQPTGLTDKEKAEIKRFFDKVDKNEDKVVVVDEIKAAMAADGYVPEEGELDDIMTDFDADESGGITLQEVYTFEEKRRSDSGREDLQAFRFLRQEPSTADAEVEVEKTFEPAKITLTKDEKAELDEMFKEADTNEDESVDKTELSAVMVKHGVDKSTVGKMADHVIEILDGKSKEPANKKIEVEEIYAHVLKGKIMRAKMQAQMQANRDAAADGGESAEGELSAFRFTSLLKSAPDTERVEKKPAGKEKVEQEILDPEIGKAKPKGKAQPTGLTDKEKAEIKRFFDKVDKNEDKVVVVDEIKAAMAADGYVPEEGELDDIMTDFDADESGGITLQEVYTFEEKRRSDSGREDLQAFRFLRQEPSTADAEVEVEKTFEPAKITLTKDEKAELDEMFKEADTNEDESVDKTELSAVMVKHGVDKSTVGKMADHVIEILDGKSKEPANKKIEVEEIYAHVLKGKIMRAKMQAQMQADRDAAADGGESAEGELSAFRFTSLLKTAPGRSLFKF